MLGKLNSFAAGMDQRIKKAKQAKGPPKPLTPKPKSPPKKKK